MAAPPARARADYDYLIKLLLIGDSGLSSLNLITSFHGIDLISDDSHSSDHTSFFFPIRFVCLGSLKFMIRSFYFYFSVCRCG